MDEPVVQLAADETAVIGYGSLLSIESLSRTLKEPYTGPFLFCYLEGWRRSWDVSMPNEAFYFEENDERVYPEQIIYLNLRRAPQELLNCVLFVLRHDQLEAMHNREWIYDATVVNNLLRGVRLQGGEALVYVGREENLARGLSSPRTGAIRRSYLRILESALALVDPVFRREFEHTTDPVPEDLVIEDHLDPARPSPWAAAGKSYQPDA